MLTFIDESGYPRPTDSTKNPILLGVCIHENDIKPITNQLTVYVLSTSIDSLLALAETKGKFICAQNGMTEEEFLDYGFRQIINSILEVRI